MTHTLNRRSRRPDGPQAADGAPRRQPVYPWPCARRWPCWPRRRCLHLAPRRRKRFRPARPVTASRRAAGRALPRFADAAGVTVLFDAALLGARGTGGLNGSYSVSEGFARLLAGSGLAARERSAGITYWCRRPA